MKVRILTIFPELINMFLDNGIVRKAKEQGVVDIEVFNLRDFTEDKHKSVDDYPFGGGPGMVLKAEPFINFFNQHNDGKVIYPSPQGETLSHPLALDLSKEESITIICGHYEGIDQRVIDKYVDQEISIGDYVVSGGELPGLIILDSTLRLVDGFLKNEQSAIQDSFYNNKLDAPSYTRPETIDGISVPSVLMSGNHGEIDKWKEQQSILRTLTRRPDLLCKADKDKLKQALLDIVAKL